MTQSNRTTSGESSTPSTSARSNSEVLTTESDAGEPAHAQGLVHAARDAVVDASVALSNVVGLASPLIRATTPTPSHDYGASPGILK